MFKLRIIVLDIFFGVQMCQWMNRFNEMEAVIPPQEVLYDPHKLCDYITKSNAQVVFVEEADLYISEYASIPDFVSVFRKTCEGKMVFNSSPLPSFEREDGAKDRLRFPKEGPFPCKMTMFKDPGGMGEILFGTFLHSLKHLVKARECS